MKVVSGDLEEMLSELREKEIRDVRVEALCDETYSKEGIPLLKLYVTAQPLPQTVSIWGTIRGAAPMFL